MNKKKLQKNMPYVFVLGALILIVAARTWYGEYKSAQLEKAPVETNMTDEEKARIYVSHFYDGAATPDGIKEEDYVKAGSFKTAPDGTVSFTAADDIPGKKLAQKNINLVFDFDQLPKGEAVEKDIGETVKRWRHRDFTIYSVVVRYIGPTVDTDALDQLTAYLHQRMKLRVAAYLQRKWFEQNPEKAPTDIANISKNTQTFIYDEKEIREKGQTLASAIRDVEKYKVSFVVLVDEKPDLEALRRDIADTTNFGGLIVRGKTP